MTTGRSVRSNKGIKMDTKPENPHESDLSRDISENKANLQKVKCSEKKKRFVLFLGNIPYDSTEEELTHHFRLCGVIDIRIAKTKGKAGNRGFGFVEVKDKTSYEKAFSLNHSQFKGRQINVSYSENKKDSKKNVNKKFKLTALHKQGKFGIINKNTQNRALRRRKAKLDI